MFRFVCAGGEGVVRLWTVTLNATGKSEGVSVRECTLRMGVGVWGWGWGYVYVSVCD